MEKSCFLESKVHKMACKSLVNRAHNLLIPLYSIQFTLVNELSK